jgi:type IV secretion system protein VirB9
VHSRGRGQSLDHARRGLNDGVHTRLTFAAQAEQPAIFILNEVGSESLLNFSLDEGDVILHRVARRFIVRRGSLAGCVVNRGYTGSGERLKRPCSSSPATV